MSNLNKLDSLFSFLSNGEWEREFQITLETASNPGWHLKLPKIGTPYEFLEFDKEVENLGENEEEFIIIYVDSQNLRGSCSAGLLDELVDRMLKKIDCM